MEKWSDWLIGLCLGLFVAGGLYLLYLGLRNVWLSWASRTWPVTEGVVAKSGTASTVSRDSKTGARSTMYEAKLAFSYQAGGARHETEKLYFGQTGG